MRCYLYSTGTDKRIISCTVGAGFAQRAIGFDVELRRVQKSFYEPWLHRNDSSNIPLRSRAVNAFKSEAFFRRTANVTAFGMLIVLVC